MNFELVTQADPSNPIVGDLKLTIGQITLVDGSAAVAQHLRNRLRFFLAEWFLDRRRGLPFFQKVFVKNPDQPAIRAIFRRVVRETPGIAAVDGLTLAINANREATISFTATLDQPGDPLVFSDFVIGE